MSRSYCSSDDEEVQCTYWASPQSTGDNASGPSTHGAWRNTLNMKCGAGRWVRNERHTNVSCECALTSRFHSGHGQSFLPLKCLSPVGDQVLTQSWTNPNTRTASPFCPTSTKTGNRYLHCWQRSAESHRQL